jgi:hypothetical protein
MKSILHLYAFLASVVLLTACLSADLEGQSSEPVNEATTEQAVSDDWTLYTSDGRPPIECDSGSLFNRAQCKGSYCDDIRAYCSPTTAVLSGPSYWAPLFSDEYPRWSDCEPGYWVTGLTCTGSYCDNISLKCSKIDNVTAQNCHYTGWTSEEYGALEFGPGFYARGASCSGRYCDWIRFWVCSF